jgi:hypothetical protein
MLTAGGPADRVAISRLARSTGRGTPATIAVVAVRDLGGRRPPLLPQLLADWQSQAPSLVIPEPDRPAPAQLAASGRAAGRLIARVARRIRLV